jgi:hypothetical protein
LVLLGLQNPVVLNPTETRIKLPVNNQRHTNNDYLVTPPYEWQEDLILDVDKMLAELRLEREQIEEAILTLERLARGRGRRRGRPPTWLKDAAAAVSAAGEEGSADVSAEPKRRGRPPGSKTKHTASAEA